MDRREKALQKLRAKIKERHASLADDFEWVPRLLGWLPDGPFALLSCAARSLHGAQPLTLAAVGLQVPAVLHCICQGQDQDAHRLRGGTRWGVSRCARFRHPAGRNGRLTRSARPRSCP
jgi:hypothetical protein